MYLPTVVNTSRKTVGRKEGSGFTHAYNDEPITYRATEAYGGNSMVRLMNPDLRIPIGTMMCWSCFCGYGCINGTFVSVYHLSVYCLSIRLYFCLSVCLSVCLPVCLSVFLSLSQIPSVSGLLLFVFSVSLPNCLSSCLLVCLSFRQSICLSRSFKIDKTILLKSLKVFWIKVYMYVQYIWFVYLSAHLFVLVFVQFLRMNKKMAVTKSNQLTHNY